ncbi:hypothetical protein OFN49_40940, partial [Escherichia coli]|nr:hypothetical protein [Escherichia coli]
QSVIVKVVVPDQVFHKFFQLIHVMPVTFIVLLTAEEKTFPGRQVLFAIAFVYVHQMSLQKTNVIHR